MSKIFLVLVIVLIILVSFLAIMGIFYFLKNYKIWHYPNIGKICLEKNINTIGAWEDESGNVKCFQIPLHPGNDEFVYLYDLSGNEIVRAGGFATIQQNEEKYRELTKGFVMSEFKCK